MFLAFDVVCWIAEEVKQLASLEAETKGRRVAVGLIASVRNGSGGGMVQPMSGRE